MLLVARGKGRGERGGALCGCGFIDGDYGEKPKLVESHMPVYGHFFVTLHD